MEKLKVEQIQSAQDKPYGDFFRKWKITTEEQDIEKIRKYCLENLAKKELPEYQEFLKNIRYGGAESGNADYYFRGYYTLGRTDYGYLFILGEPYAD